MVNYLQATRRHMVGVIKNTDRLGVVFVVLLFCFIFSSQPVITFGTVSGINAKLSVAILATLGFICLSLPSIYRQRHELIRLLGVKLFFLFCLFNTMSIAWSANPPRAIFEVGFLWLIFFLFVATLTWLPQLKVRKQLLLNTLWAGTVTICLFAWWQILGETYGASSSLTLLTSAYQSGVFGFARPTGFAHEPQFLGSLLIIPLLTSVHLLLTNNMRAPIIILSLATTATLFATISRGAFIAVVIGLLILFVSIKSSALRRLKVAGVLLVGVVVSLCLVSLAAHINTRDHISGQSAAAGVINQASLGTIDLEPLVAPQVNTQPSINPAAPSVDTPTAEPVTPTYVAESTTSRLLMSQEALQLWTKDTRTFLFGIGTGGFGAAIHEKNNSYALGSIVNNEYLQVAAELGLLGLLLFLALLLVPFYGLIKSKQWLFVSLLAAFYAQWFFFSGHINILHVWLTMALAYGTLGVSIKWHRSTHKRPA